MSGLHLLVRAFGIGEGDEVITTPFSFTASSNCILYERAKPVFVDVAPDSANIDPNFIEDAAARRTDVSLCFTVASAWTSGRADADSVTGLRYYS